MSRCWAYGPHGKRCDGNATHDADQHFTRWSDEECIDPSEAAAREKAANPLRRVTASAPVSAFPDSEVVDLEVEWTEVPDDDDLEVFEPPPPGAVIGTIQLEPGSYMAKDEQEGTKRPAVAITAGTATVLSRKGAAAPTGCFSCGCGPVAHEDEDGCSKHGCRSYIQ